MDVSFPERVIKALLGCLSLAGSNETDDFRDGRILRQMKKNMAP